MESKSEEVSTLEEDVRRLRKLLNQKEEELEEEKRKNGQLQTEKENLHVQVRTLIHQLSIDSMIYSMMSFMFWLKSGVFFCECR